MSKLLERPLPRDAALWAILHFVALGLLSGTLFLLTHIPPGLVNLDSVILAVHGLFKALYFPISLLRALWPGEATPWALSFAARTGGSILFGFTVAWAVELKRRKAQS